MERPIIGGTGGDTIIPVLPVQSSDVRQIFLNDLGITTPGSCVQNADGTQTIPQNEGTHPVFSGASAADVIVPFSIGSYISQVDKHTSTDMHGNKVRY